MAISEPSAGNPPLVLIVEDEVLIRIALTEFLEDNGFRTMEAANATEALQAIEKTGRNIDLVFTDIRMPGAMDGIALAQWVHQQLPSIPVIVASGYGENEDAARKAGEDFYTKPYRFDELVTRLRATIAAHQRDSRSA